MDLSNVNKKLLKYLIITIAACIGILLIMFIVKLIIGTKFSYAKIEEKMQDAAMSYLKDEDVGISLPTGNEVITIEVDDLVANKNMKELSKYVKNKNITCTGNVVVRKQDDNYLYIPYLNCGKDYTTTTLKDYILTNEKQVETGDGLYYANNQYIYRGEYLNNYVKFANQLWRIIKIDAEGNIKLLQDETKVRNNWDNRYNVDDKSSVGINNYELSRVNKKLDEIYNDIFTDEDKKYITSKNLCIGKRYIGDTTKDGSTECYEVFENQKIGLIQVDEFLNASLDSNCQKIRDGACQNYNYLTKYDSDWWTITANAANTSNVYEISRGKVNTAIASISKLIRPTIYLNSDVIYASGDGSEENPYIFK